LNESDIHGTHTPIHITPGPEAAFRVQEDRFQEDRFQEDTQFEAVSLGHDEAT
jgi:hypothetical protein